jgi:hypothetical protein
VRWLNQNASAIAGVGFASASAPMIEVKQDLQCLLDDRVGLAPFDINDKSYAACFVLELRIVQPLLRRRAGAPRLAAHFRFCFSDHAVEMLSPVRIN